MPKQKTHKGVKKRFKVTGSGKIMRAKSRRCHKLAKKRASKKRQKRNEAEVKKANKKRIKQMLSS